ncbi:cyclase family protein [Halocatena marina]|uniref:cyclase family protein n=1 Tax=Halocatena marina TaxID=2934937 RepID=UPI00200F3766|nr:cyclase family protein [Halocatena marina]
MPLIDCSHRIETGMPVYPGSDSVSVQPSATVERDGAHVTNLQMETHAGTHIDVPSHMIADGRTLDAFDVSLFTFDALIVDCTGKASREPITVADLPEPSDNDLLVLHTGWSKHWGTDAYRDHPYLDKDAATWCADHGYSVGIDCFSPDPTPSVDKTRESDSEPDGYPAHDALFATDRRIVENLTNLTALAREFELLAFPLAIPDGDGSPVRAVARCD